MEGFQIGQRKSRESITLALSPAPCHQRLPHRHSTGRMETTCDRRYRSGRHAAPNDEDDSFGRRLGLRQGRHESALRDTRGGDKLCLSLSRSNAQQLGQWSSSGNDSRFCNRPAGDDTKRTDGFYHEWTSADEDCRGCRASGKIIGGCDRHSDESRTGGNI